MLALCQREYALWRRANAQNVRLYILSVLTVHQPFYISICISTDIYTDIYFDWFINIFIIYYILLIIYINFIENDNEHWPLHPADSIGNDGIWFGNLFGVPVYVTTKAEFHLFLVACSNFYFATSSSTCYEYRWITDAQVALYLFIRIKWNLFRRIMSSWKPKIRVKTWQN